MKICLSAYVQALPFSKASEYSEVIIQDSSSLTSSIWYYLQTSQTTAPSSQCCEVIFQVIQQPRWFLGMDCGNGTAEAIGFYLFLCIAFRPKSYMENTHMQKVRLFAMISTKNLACFEKKKKKCSIITRTCESTCLCLIFFSAVLPSVFLLA